MTVTRDELIELYANELGCNKATAEKAIKAFETVLTEQVFPNYEVNLFGTKFKRVFVEEEDDAEETVEESDEEEVEDDEEVEEAAIS